MGGINCKHERTEVIEVNATYTKNLLWKHEIVTERCLDCPATFRRDRCKGRLTNWTYNDQTVTVKECSHDKYDVNEATTSVERESTLGGSVMRLFMGPAMDGIQYHRYLAAEATCKRCGFHFYVRAEYDKAWENQQQVEKRTTNWKPIKHEVAENKTVTHTEFVPVPPKTS